jgi:small-conductance mechanosensitive channel
MEETLTNLTGDLTELLLPWVAILISIVVAILFKDFATSLSKGIAFQMDKAFNEGDKVLLDGAEATILKIGMRQTVFGVYSDRGYVWRYVPNERILNLKLEKVIDAELHKDTEEEKGIRIQRLIDAAQDAHIQKNEEFIKKNREEIEKLKGN